MNPTRRPRGFTLIEIMLVVAIIGVLAAIAVPNFIRFQARSKQSEAKTNLKALFGGQKSAFAEQNTYQVTLGDIGFSPERGNRYYYDLGIFGGGTCPGLEDRATPVATVTNPVGAVAADEFRYGPQYAAGTLNSSTATPGAGAVTYTIAAAGVTIPTGFPGVFGTCPTCAFVANAMGQIDNDTGPDLFIVSSEFTDVAAAPCAEAVTNNHPGAPLSVRNDVNCD